MILIIAPLDRPVMIRAESLLPRFEFLASRITQKAEESSVKGVNKQHMSGIDIACMSPICLGRGRKPKHVETDTCGDIGRRSYAISLVDCLLALIILFHKPYFSHLAQNVQWGLQIEGRSRATAQVMAGLKDNLPKLRHCTT